MFGNWKLGEILAGAEWGYFNFRNHSEFIFIREKAADSEYCADDAILRVIKNFDCFLQNSNFDENLIDQAWDEFLHYLNVILERTYIRFLNNSLRDGFCSSDFWSNIQPFITFDESKVRELLSWQISEFRISLFKTLF